MFTLSVILSLFLLSSPLVQAQTTTPQPKRFVLQEKLEQRLENRIASISAKISNFIGKRVILKEAQITLVSGTSLTISYQDKTYTINTNSQTKLLRRFWGKASFSDFKVGDNLTIYGKWTDENKTTILATLIRDLSIQKRFGVFIGTITTISGNIWTIDTVTRGIQTTTVNSTTKFKNRKEQIISQSDVLVGHRIRIRGLWDKQSNTLTEVTQIKDFTLPLQPKNTTTPTP